MDAVCCADCLTGPRRKCRQSGSGWRFGRIYQDIEEVRAAVRAYFERYNQHWLLEKNDHRSPAETRRYWMAATITAQEAA